MAPVYQTTPRKDGKTQEQADKDMETHVGTYYITEEERTFDGAGDTSVAPPAISKPAPKRPTRKQSPKPKGKSGNTEGESSPLTRKSARVASKRAASDMQLSDEVDDQTQQPAKKAKMSPPQKVKKRAATESSNPEEDAQEQSASKRVKMSGPAPAAKATTTTPTKTKATVPPSKTSKASLSSAAVKKSTGRPAPISKELPKAKYVEKKSIATAPVTEEADEETDIDEAVDEEEEETTTKASKGKGKGRKPAAKVFQGTKSGFGTSVEKPEDAPLDQPWKCANRDCNSGQTYHPRDGANSFGRKVISNFFGRNKKETNLIDGDVWHNYCRKCYQRGTYRVNVISNLEKVKYYISNIDMQLDRLELWRPQATFTVQLSKGAGDRLRKYYKERTKAGATIASAQAAVTKTPQTNAKGKVKPLSLEDAFPADQLEFFEDNYVADNQSYLDLKLALNWVRNLAENGQIDSMPPMEFLINEQTEGETVIDPTTNYERWCALEDGVDFDEEGNGEEGGEDEDAGVDEGQEDAEALDAGNGDNESTELAGDDLNETEKAGNDDSQTEDAGGDDIQTANPDNGDVSSVDGTTGEVKKIESADDDTNETDDARDGEADSDEESDDEVREAIKALSQDAIGTLTKGVAGTKSTPLNTDWYDNDGESDEDYDEEYDEEELDDPKTPPLPANGPWKLTPTGKGSPIKMGQSSTAYITRDIGPAERNTRKRTYASGDYGDSSFESSPPKKVDTSPPTTYTGPDASTVFKRKREIEEEVANRNYDDTESEGESSPSKKQKL